MPSGDPGRFESPAAGSSPAPAPTTNGDAVLRCEGLRKRFGARQAVDGISFEIARGETYGLLGPNGAGKTTTISMVCGILARDGGTVVVDGRPLDVGTTSAKAAIGLVPQDLAIYPDLTARENLVFFGRLYGLGGRDLAARVDEVLDVVDLTDRAKERGRGGPVGARPGGESRGSAGRRLARRGARRGEGQPRVGTGCGGCRRVGRDIGDGRR
jgi:ABC-type sugar transport system ATPase subunit